MKNWGKQMMGIETRQGEKQTSARQVSAASSSNQWIYDI
jgi:hypothetical protein